ncbi:hypothetical protein F5878DRAFT_618447 [Lentinula raphanica]|uniref:Uncharacterized protein n=1 Tax=Lentinula raphanica TaxID=153919 RepID=A0AA38PA28_9AGAR|nr:hypothetical protein F5878DRAFT_618447 [Lentinula raphanica]
MHRSTASQALTILLIGAAIAPGIIAAPTPTLPRSFDGQGSLSGGQPDRPRVVTFWNRGVDYASVVSRHDAAVDQTEPEREHDQDGRDSTDPDNLSFPFNSEERVILEHRGVPERMKSTMNNFNFKKKKADKMAKAQEEAQKTEEAQRMEEAQRRQEEQRQEEARRKDEAQRKEQEDDQSALARLRQDSYTEILDTWYRLHDFGKSDMYEEFDRVYKTQIAQMAEDASRVMKKQLPFPNHALLNECIDLPLDIEEAKSGKVNVGRSKRQRYRDYRYPPEVPELVAPSSVIEDNGGKESEG